jgi:hypothetical protein
MPYTAPPAPVTTTWWNANVKDQVISTVTSATRPAGTEGQVIYETDTDRVLMHDGAAWVRIAHGSASGRTGCRLRRAANQSITTATDTTVTWDTEDQDTDGFITVSSDTITIPSGLDGVYAMTAYVVWAATPGATSNVRFEFAGTTGDFRTSVGASSVAFQAQTVAVPCWALSATNTVKLRVYQATGASINITAALQLFRLYR